METVKEFFNAIKGQLSERLANPFTGAFCIAWVIWNFRLLMVFVGKGTYQEKFLYIDTSLYPDWKFWAVRGVAIPMATAVAYLWAYPRATRWLAEDYRKQQTKANNLMKAAEGAALLSVDESRALRTKYTEAEQAWNSERDRLTTEIDTSKETNLTLARRNAELRQELDKFGERNEGPTPPDMDFVRTFENELKSEEGGDLARLNVDGAQSEMSKKDLDRAVLKVGPEGAKHLSGNLSAPHYSRRQLQVMSVLREGKQLTPDELVSTLRGDKFQIHRAIDRLRELGLLDVARPGRAIYLTAHGRAVLGAFVDEGQWVFADEGF